MMSIDVLRENGIEVTDAQSRTIEIYVYLHDALKIAPERMDDSQSGVAAKLTKLLRHGEDSAEWADQLLRDKGLGNDFIATNLTPQAHLWCKTSDVGPRMKTIRQLKVGGQATTSLEVKHSLSKSINKFTTSFQKISCTQDYGMPYKCGEPY